MKWRSKNTVRILAKGGILTPAYLLKILEIVKASGNKHVHFGSRQDLLFQVSENQMKTLHDAFGNLHIDFMIHARNEINVQNIVSSYVASEMTAATSWLTEGTYLNVLENFNFKPILRVNISDPKQSLVPLFYGHLNFIASSVKDYWYLYIRKEYDSLPECWPVLILTTDIAVFSKTIERNWLLLDKAGIAELFRQTQKELNYNWRKIEIPFKNETLPPQDYEGFGRMYNSNNSWAGFFWRNNNYDIAFLEEICKLCHRTNNTKICLTPWKSFLVKDIKDIDLIHWQRLIGHYGINMRHSAFELIWHLPLQDKHALRLKRFLVKKFDKNDICVHGLTFGIKTKPEPSFCAIQIERIPGLPILKNWNLFNSYKILHAKQFNANTCEYIEHASQLPRNQLPGELNQLTLKFYAQLHNTSDTHLTARKPKEAEKRLVYQCTHCLTVYDEQIVGSAFKLLPDSFTCELCDAPKADFNVVFMNNTLQNVSV